MIWTLVYDASGLTSVQLNYRVTPGLRAPAPANLLYAGGEWTTVQMIDVPLTGGLAPETNPLPKYIADMVCGYTFSLMCCLFDVWIID